MIFMASAALMLAEIAVLNRIGRKQGTWRQVFGVELPASTPAGAPLRTRQPPPSFVVAGGLLLVLSVAAFALPRPAEIIPPRLSFTQFPLELGQWRGSRQSLDAIFTDQLQMDDYVLADYVNDAGISANFYVSWYNSQRKGEAVHSPRACLPGGGWQIQELAQRTLPGITIDDKALRVNRAIVALGNQRALIYYWFQQRGRIIDNEFAVKWYLFWDAVTRHRTDGAMVRLMTALPLGGDVSEADRQLTEFASRVAPDLPRYIPQ
jgi:EpsI family protein